MGALTEIPDIFIALLQYSVEGRVPQSYGWPGGSL
jgi:hypothetical protein